MEFNDGNMYHYVTNPDQYVQARNMYEMRTCSAKEGRYMYVDPQFALQRAWLQPRLEAYLHYQFPYQNAGTPEQQADFLCDTLGVLRPNEMIMLDTEDQSGLRDPVEFVQRWCARAEVRLNTLAWIYVPRSLSGVLTRAVTSPRIIKAPRYSGHAGRGVAPNWPYDVWQYTDRGHFPGSAHGPGDCNVTSLTAGELLNRCRRAGGMRPTLRLGDSGPYVTELQQFLSEGS